MVHDFYEYMNGVRPYGWACIYFLFVFQKWYDKNPSYLSWPFFNFIIHFHLSMSLFITITNSVFSFFFSYVSVSFLSHLEPWRTPFLIYFPFFLNTTIYLLVSSFSLSLLSFCFDILLMPHQIKLLTPRSREFLKQFVVSMDKSCMNLGVRQRIYQPHGLDLLYLDAVLIISVPDGIDGMFSLLFQNNSRKPNKLLSPFYQYVYSTILHDFRSSKLLRLQSKVLRYVPRSF